MSAKCLLRSEIDITEGLQKSMKIIVYYCPACERYLQPPRTWVKALLESEELLTFCVKRLKDYLKDYLNTDRLAHAEFISTEPHSKRIKVKLQVQKEVLSPLLEQTYTVEYVVHDQLCGSCSHAQANPVPWVSVVKLRQQHVAHRRTFFYLEQLILKHGADKNAVWINKQMDQGIDFFFNYRTHAVRFVDFVGCVSPIKRRNDKQLLSHDSESNTYHFKYTISVEISPICPKDLILLPHKLFVSMGGKFGPLVICSRVTCAIFFLDPFTLRHNCLGAKEYFGLPFQALLSSSQLVEYIVLDIQVASPVISSVMNYVRADAKVARVSDYGKNDTIFNVPTHLGHCLHPGDYALGYDLSGANINDTELDKYTNFALPDVILIEKSNE